jgi:hypothetical protein
MDYKKVANMSIKTAKTGIFRFICFGTYLYYAKLFDVFNLCLYLLCPEPLELSHRGV